MQLFQIILLILFYLQNSNEPVKTYNKIYYKNFNICNYIKQKDIYNLSKINKEFYFIYKKEISKCIYCNSPFVNFKIRKCNRKLCSTNKSKSTNESTNENNDDNSIFKKIKLI